MFKNISLLNKVIAIIALLLSITIGMFYSDILPVLTNFTKRYVQTSNGEIVDKQIFVLELGLLLLMCFGVCVFIVLLLRLPKRFAVLFKSAFDTEKISDTFLVDSKIASKTYTKAVVVFSSLFALIMHIKFLLFGNYSRESTFETITSFLFFISALILIVVLFKLKKASIPKMDKSIMYKWLLLCTILLLFIFLEEISYGQHFFEWKASGVFKENNFQSETNLHNFINPLFRFLYPTIGIGLFLVLFLIWFYYNGEKPIWLQILTPHKSLFVLVLFMAFTSCYIGHTETFEELLSLFTLLYSIRIYLYLRNEIDTSRDS